MTNDAKPPALSPRDRQAAALLAAGRTILETAAELKVSAATVERAKRKPGFAEVVRELRAEATAAIMGAFVGAAREAVGVLVGLMRTATRNDAVKVRAAAHVVQFALGYAEAADLRAEVAELKAIFLEWKEHEPGGKFFPPEPVQAAGNAGETPVPPGTPVTPETGPDFNHAFPGE